MKTKTLLILASLAVLATSARAASTQTETVVLPTYVVAAPRELPVDHRINTSLAELRQQAHAAVAAELITIKEQATDKSLSLTSRLMRSGTFAKL
jgi:hypothetical protein